MKKEHLEQREDQENVIKNEKDNIEDRVNITIKTERMILISSGKDEEKVTKVKNCGKDRE